MRIFSRSIKPNTVLAIKIGLAILAVVIATVTFHKPTSQDRVSYWGELITTDNASPSVDIRKGCKISTFGIYPWLKPGAARDARWAAVSHRALTSMGMPSEAADRAVARLAAGHPDEAVLIGDTHGVASVSGQLYYPAFTTTYKSTGYSVCLGTMTDFGNAYRQEAGLLYRITDLNGRTWHVGEMLACGNVSLFIPAPEGWKAPSEMQKVHQLPEPGMIGIFIIALLAVWIALRRRK